MKNTLRITHPALAEQVSAQSVLSADDVTSGSGKKLLWECSKDPVHQWEATVASRAKTGRGCPYCSGQRVLPGVNDLKTLRPDLATSWADEKDMGTVSSGSNYKAHWTCDLGHGYAMKVKDRAKGRGCPVCSHHTVLTGYNDLGTKHPEIAGQWHQEKNGELLPSTVLFHSNTKAWWQCPHNADHQWSTAIRNRTVLGSGCPMCSGAKTSRQDSLAVKYPEIAAQFSDDNAISADTVSIGSHTSYLWECEIGHIWKAPIRNRTVRGHQCPYCSGKLVIVGETDLPTTHPALAREWDDPEPVNTVSKGSHYLAQWKCEKHGHTWKAEVYNRVRGNGCPVCASSSISSVAEDEIRDHIVSLGFSAEKDRKVLGRKELDIYVPEKKFAVEYNSIYYHSENMGKDKFYHYNKFKECQDQGISLFQVWGDDYAQSPELVKKMIAHKLGVNETETIYARNTVLTTVNRADAADFMNKHHLQGSHKTSSSYGLVSKHSQEVVAIMSVAFKAKRNALEIVRFATAKTIPGGFTKLLTGVLKAYADNGNTGIQEILSYSHNDHSWGEVYEKNGFVKVHGGVPGYFYVVNGKREHRLNFSPKRFRERDDLLFEEGKTERELAELNSLVRIWDAGSSLWSKTLG